MSEEYFSHKLYPITIQSQCHLDYIESPKHSRNPLEDRWHNQIVDRFNQDQNEQEQLQTFTEQGMKQQKNVQMPKGVTGLLGKRCHFKTIEDNDYIRKDLINDQWNADDDELIPRQLWDDVNDQVSNGQQNSVKNYYQTEAQPQLKRQRLDIRDEMHNDPNLETSVQPILKKQPSKRVANVKRAFPAEEEQSTTNKNLLQLDSPIVHANNQGNQTQTNAQDNHEDENQSVLTGRSTLYKSLNNDEQKFQFFLKRTSIRDIGRFYRKQFYKFKENEKIKFELIDVENLDKILPYIKSYLAQEFKELWPSLNENDREKLAVFLIPLIYNDRCHLDKNDKQVSKDQFIRETFAKLELHGEANAFKIYWLAKNKYNIERMKAFFAVPLFNFFLHHYVDSSDMDAFLDAEKVRSNSAKGKSQTEVNQFKLERMRLKKIGLKKLKESMPLAQWWTSTQ